jgi:hypothetical protein
MPRALDTAMMKHRNGVMIFPVFRFVMVLITVQLGAANVVLMGNNLTMSFDDIEASFGKLWTTYCRLALSHSIVKLAFFVCMPCLYA